MNRLPTLEEVRWEQRRRSFYRFFCDAWPHIPGEGGNPLIANWSLKAVCDRFERLARGSLGKNGLIVNIPPGLGKSTIASVAFPAWVWLWWPEWTTLQVSGSEDVAIRDSMKCRELIRSDWYQSSNVPWEISKGKDGTEWFKNTRGGERQMSTILSKVTGKRVHHLGIDDPNDTKDISELKLQQVWDAYSLALANRLKDMRTGTTSLIQQRTHLKDLTGSIMDAEGLDFWHHLIIRQLYETGDQTSPPEDPRTQDGDLLFPERFPQWVIDREAGRLKSFGFAGQHQQRPIPKDGGTWKTALIETIDVAPAGMVEVRGWDMGASKGKGDPTAGARLGYNRASGKYVIVHMEREQTDEPRRLIRSLAERDGKDVRISIPQDPGQAGKDQVRSFTQELSGFSFSFSPESGAKETRWEPFQSQVNGGNVQMVRGSWNERLLDEMRTNGQVHDDQLDALARAFAKVEAARDPLLDAMYEGMERDKQAAESVDPLDPNRIVVPDGFEMPEIDNDW